MTLCHHFDLMNFNEAKQGLVQKCNLYPLIIIFIESDTLKRITLAPLGNFMPVIPTGSTKDPTQIDNLTIILKCGGFTLRRGFYLIVLLLVLQIRFVWTFIPIKSRLYVS